MDPKQTLSYADPQTAGTHSPVDGSAKSALIWSLFFLVTPLPSIIAVVCGIVGIDRTWTGAVRGRWQAWTGLLLGLAGLAFWIAAPILVYQAYSTSRPIKVAVELHGLGSALQQYAKDNNGRFPDNFEFTADKYTRFMVACDRLGDEPPPGSTDAEILANIKTGRCTSYGYLGMGYRLGDKSPSEEQSTPIAFICYSYSAAGKDKVSILFADGEVQTLDRRQGLQVIQQRINELARVVPATQPK